MFRGWDLAQGEDVAGQVASLIDYDRVRRRVEEGALGDLEFVAPLLGAIYLTGRGFEAVKLAEALADDCLARVSVSVMSRLAGVLFLLESANERRSAAPVFVYTPLIMDPPGDAHIFLSHAHEDKAIARCMQRYFRAYGLGTWLDERELRPGAELDKSLEKHIAGAHTVVVVASASAAKSAWVRRELAFARGRGKPVVPLFLEHLEDHELFRGHLGLDATSRAEFGHVLHTLLTELLASSGLPLPPIDRDVVEVELRALAREERDLGPLILGCLDSEGLHQDNVETIRRAPFHALDFALNALYMRAPSERSAMHAAYGFQWVGAGARALASWIAQTGDGGDVLVMAVYGRLGPGTIDTAIRLLGACSAPNNHALYTFIAENAEGLNGRQRAEAVRLVTWPVRGLERFGDVLGRVAWRHLPDAPEIPRMWCRWIDSGAFDDGVWIERLSRYLASARAEGLPGCDAVEDSLRGHVRRLVRSGEKANVWTALDHLRAAAIARATVLGTLVGEISGADGTAEWQRWEERDPDGAEEMMCYVHEFVLATSDGDWLGAMNRAEQRLKARRHARTHSTTG
jgi:hypothetical protein